MVDSNKPIIFEPGHFMNAGIKGDTLNLTSRYYYRYQDVLNLLKEERDYGVIDAKKTA